MFVVIAVFRWVLSGSKKHWFCNVIVWRRRLLSCCCEWRLGEIHREDSIINSRVHMPSISSGSHADVGTLSWARMASLRYGGYEWNRGLYQIDSDMW